MKLRSTRFFIISILLFSYSEYSIGQSNIQKTLKDVYKDAFKIGVSVNPSMVNGASNAGQDIVVEQFNSITIENHMKAQLINPMPGVFKFSAADSFVEFGNKHNMHVIGHTLVWHNQTPEWFFKNADGSPKSKEDVKQRLKEHIELVASRYAGKVHAWDVVNEVIDDDGSYRPTTWVNGVGDGDELVRLSFTYAAQYAPNTELYYNDFNAWRPEKVKGIVRMVKMLQAAGIKIDGVGIQGHWGLNFPKTKYIEDAIDAYAACGIKVMITELDVDVLPLTREGQIIGQAFTHKQFQNEEFREYLDPYKNGLPKEVQKALTKRYAELFEIFYRKKSKIDRITFWGLKDDDSWKNGYPIPGRTNYPLLWDRAGKAKPAFNAILKIPK